MVMAGCAGIAGTLRTGVAIGFSAVATGFSGEIEVLGSWAEQRNPARKTMARRVRKLRKGMEDDRRKSKPASI
jgi:hypothetical protein